MSEPRIIVVDRSLLAINMFRLLLASLAPRLIVSSSLEDAATHVGHRDGVDLMIINSNVLGGNFNRQLDWLCDDARLAKVPKIFLCRDVPSDSAKRPVLERLPQARLMARPFFPPDLAKVVAELCP